MRHSGTYQYNLKNHLGNTRAMYSKSAGTGQVATPVQSTDYYPFGKSFENNNASKNRYLYNGKELQDQVIGGTAFGWYDYGARFYDSEIGRFHTQDRFAEKYLNFTPYQYGANNPALYVDVNGDSIQVTTDAILAIYHALEANVKFDVNNGMIDPESFKEQAEKSDDIVLKDLYEIASNERMVEMFVSNYETYKDANGNVQKKEFAQPRDFDIKDFGPDIYKQQKSQGEPDGKTIQGNLGSTLTTDPKSLKRSLNGNIQVIINGKGSLNHRAIGVAHEFGHVVLYLRGLPFRHREEGADKAIYKDRVAIVLKRLGYDY